MALNDWEIVLVIVLGGLIFSGVLTSSLINFGLSLLSSKGEYRLLKRIAGIALILAAIAVTYAFFCAMWASWQR